MPTPIVIPNVGESVTSGVIAAWRKKDGEYVERDDVVLDLETDKITMEVRAAVSGVIRTTAKEGDTVEIGAVVGEIDESAPAPAAASAGAAAPTAAGREAPQEPPAAAPASHNNGAHATDADVRATPLARKLAEEKGIDLAQVRGTGPGSRVREQDVL